MPRRKKQGADRQPPTDRNGASPPSGHNVVGGIAGDRLRSFVERIERLEEEKRTVAADIKEVYAEAEGTGFAPKIMRILIKERRMDMDDFDEQEALLDVYRRALGMFIDTPLGAAAVHAVEKKTGAPDAVARKAGFDDGAAGHKDHAARWAPGERGHGDYELGWADGQRQRIERMTDISGLDDAIES